MFAHQKERTLHL